MELKPLHVLQEAFARQLFSEEDREHQPRQVRHLGAPCQMVMRPTTKHGDLRWFHGNIARYIFGTIHDKTNFPLKIVIDWDIDGAV